MHRTAYVLGAVLALAAGKGCSARAQVAQAVSSADVVARIQRLREELRADSKDFRIRDVEFPAGPARRCRRLEVGFQLDATYSNPYDPRDTDVEARFTLPDGAELSVPAFFAIAYEPASGVTQLQGGIAFKPAGERGWRVRFAPPAVGQYSFHLTARNAAGETARSETHSFTVAPAGGPGFVQISAENPVYSEDSADGDLLLGTGASVAWTRAGDRGKPTACHEYYFGRARGLMSATRVWMCHWAWLEWTPQLDQPRTSWAGYAGAGYYNQMMAAELDRVFELGEQNGLRIMLVTDDNNEHFGSGGVEEWYDNPYNAVNGGPCERPSEVFTAEEARRLYRNRLRYIVARWGYSTWLWAINSWNDEGEPTPEVRRWLIEMRDYVHDLVRGYRPIVYGSNLRADDIMDCVQAGPGDLDLSKPNVAQELEFPRDRAWFAQVVRQTIWRDLARGSACDMVWPHTEVDELSAWDIFAGPLTESLASGECPDARDSCANGLYVALGRPAAFL
jgi:hypothetical protein